jgi:hypothetical protein
LKVGSYKVGCFDFRLLPNGSTFAVSKSPKSLCFRGLRDEDLMTTEFLLDMEMELFLWDFTSFA